MPRHRKKKSTAPQSSAPQISAPQIPTPQSSALSQFKPIPALDLETPSPPARESSSITVHPSVYNGGYPYPGSKEIFESIVCENDYAHLSPEELRFLDLEISMDPARWDPHSFEEARLRYYLDVGRTSVPQFGPPTPASAFSVSSGVKPTSSEVVDSVPGSEFRYLGLGCPVPGLSLDGESATTICSLCAAKLDADARGYEEYEELDRGTPTLSASRHRDTHGQKKRSRISRRVRRLERTVESLSHGLILALTELKDFQGRSEGRKTDNSCIVDALSTSLSGLSTVVDHPDSTPGASASDATPHPSEQPDPTTQREVVTKSGALSGSREPKPCPSAEPNNVVDPTVAGNDSSLCISIDGSPVSGLLKPILDFMTCPEVFQFLKQAEAHPGLRCIQLFDLNWVADNLFNVHGGILIYCLQKSFIPMNAISGVTGSSAWSQDPELMQKLDGTYRKHLRPHIDTDGSRNSVAEVAWESYCFELGDVFSEQFPDSESATPFFQNMSRDYDCLGPIITTSYIEDLSTLWTEVHPALLEVTRWLEPFIDYGPDYHRETPLYDATIALGRHAHELFNQRGGVKGPAMFSTMRANNLMRLLCEHRFGELRKMQREMESVMISAVSRNFESAVNAAEVAALVDRARQTTLWRVTEPRDAQIQDALARREIRLMRSYRPQLLRPGTAAAQIRSDVFDVLVQTGRWVDAEGGPVGEREVFWDGIASL